MAFGQSEDESCQAFAAELAGQAFGGLWSAAVAVGIESQIDGSGTVAQLPKLTRINPFSA